MLRIASRYARELQARFHTTGHLFERRYHAVVVDADTCLLELLRYIHLNPVRASMITLPVERPWSSHHAYLGQRSEPWVTTDFALARFHRDAACAVAAYDHFIYADLPISSPLAARNPNDRRILGSDDFAAKLLRERCRTPSADTTKRDLTLSPPGGSLCRAVNIPTRGHELGRFGVFFGVACGFSTYLGSNMHP